MEFSWITYILPILNIFAFSNFPSPDFDVIWGRHFALGQKHWCFTISTHKSFLNEISLILSCQLKWLSQVNSDSYRFLDNLIKIFFTANISLWKWLRNNAIELEVEWSFLQGISFDVKIKILCTFVNDWKLKEAFLLTISYTSTTP